MEEFFHTLTLVPILKRQTMNKLTKGFLLILIVFAYSCEKKTDDQETIIFGRIVDSETGEPVKDVSIYKSTHCNGGPAHDTIFTGNKTDLDGKFEMKLNLWYANYDPPCYDFLFVQHPGYFDSPISAKRGAINECNITLVKNAYLKVHIKNATPYNSSDWIRFWIGSNGIYGDWMYNDFGINIDTTIITVALPNYTHKLYWKSVKNGITTNSNQDVYFPSGDTINYSVLY